MPRSNFFILLRVRSSFIIRGAQRRGHLHFSHLSGAFIRSNGKGLINLLSEGKKLLLFQDKPRSNLTYPIPSGVQRKSRSVQLFLSNLCKLTLLHAAEVALTPVPPAFNPKLWRVLKLWRRIFYCSCNINNPTCHTLFVAQISRRTTLAVQLVMAGTHSPAGRIGSGSRVAPRNGHPGGLWCTQRGKMGAHLPEEFTYLVSLAPT